MKPKKKIEIWAWASYDFANSAFATSIIAGFFPLFFKEYWSLGVDATVTTARLGFTHSIAGLLIALTAPFLGAFADQLAKRKQFLFGFACLGIIATGCLASLSKGQWEWAILLFFFASVGFSCSNIFYDSLYTYAFLN